MSKINPYIPNFEYAIAGETVFHTAYGLVVIQYTKVAKYNINSRIVIGLDAHNQDYVDSITACFDNNGMQHKSYTTEPKHPTIFRTQEQCKNYWVWEYYHQQENT